MKKDLITVYITNYNYGNYIDQCVKSILDQSYRNIEMIIIDDGSNDKLKENLKNTKRIKRLKLFIKKIKV